MIFIDIETAPLPETETAQFMPEFTAPANYKDPDKIRAYVQEAKAKWTEDGALSALTGRVLVIGALDGNAEGEGFQYWDGDEPQLLDSFWRSWESDFLAGICGFCIKSFDLPFLIRRSWRHNVTPARSLFVKDRYDARIVDLAEKWQCGSRDPRDRVSLDHLARHLGVGFKNCSGKDFAELWATDKAAALEYLKNDLLLTRDACERMLP